MAELKIRFYDEALEFFTPPPSSDVALVHQARDVKVVLLLDILEFVGAEEAVDDAPDHLWWMIGGGADVLVEVHGFLVGFCEHPPILDVDY